jgi:hypothetical protein
VITAMALPARSSLPTSLINTLSGASRSRTQVVPSTPFLVCYPCTVTPHGDGGPGMGSCRDSQRVVAEPASRLASMIF